jgi:beta-lactamase superfamily II metal-dependent hydrolase
VIYPTDRLLNGSSSDMNNASVVTRLVYGDTYFLFTSDIHWDAEGMILRSSLPM